MGQDASSRHERLMLEAVEDAASALDRAAHEYERARESRDRAVRAAVRAGVSTGVVARAANLSDGRVSQLAYASKLA